VVASIRPVKVGVALALDRDAGELFADARALEGAGADSFCAASTDGQLVLLAAIAAVTWRSRVMVVDVEPGPAIDTLVRVARGRVEMASTVAPGDELAVSAGDQPEERWIRVPFPEGRVGWNELRAKAEAEGVAGIILPNDPRLLDLLRNPDVTDDRSDLRLAFG